MTIRIPRTNFDLDGLKRLRDAVEKLESLFPDCDITIEPRRPLLEVADARTNREKVIEATREQAATVEEIARATGLDDKRIRGVLTAPDLIFEKETKAGSVAYKFNGTRERARSK